MRVVLASTNPTKHRAVAQALRRLFPEEDHEVVGVAVTPGPPPYTEQRILEAARHRVHQARARIPKGDFWVGIEAGVQPAPRGPWFMTAWVVVEDAAGRWVPARAGTFPLPPRLVVLLKQGLPLEEALTRWRPQEAARRRTGGLVGVLSDGRLLRESLYVPAVMLAFLPWRRPELW